MHTYRLQRALYLYNMTRSRPSHAAYHEKVCGELVEECHKIVTDEMRDFALPRAESDGRDSYLVLVIRGRDRDDRSKRCRMIRKMILEWVPNFPVHHLDVTSDPYHDGGRLWNAINAYITRIEQQVAAQQDGA